MNNVSFVVDLLLKSSGFVNIVVLDVGCEIKLDWIVKSKVIGIQVS